MSKLEELIKEKCPNGVEYVTINDLITNKEIKLLTPSIKVKRNDYKTIGNIPIISQEQEYISGYYDNYDPKIPDGEYVCFGDHSEHIKYVNFQFVQGADGLKIMQVISKKINVRFFYHVILNFYVRHNNYERHFKYLMETSIPVPPLGVQQEIVRILDNFSELYKELSEQLSKELKARKRQYEYYRNKLVNNKKNMILGEILKIKNGKDYKSFKTGNIPVYGSGGIMSYTSKYVYDKPSVLIPRKGSINKLYYVDEPFWNVDTIFYTEINDNIVLPKYIFYCLENEHLEELNTAGGVPSLTQSVLNKVRLYIPSIERQSKVVEKLDKLYNLINDISEGLPAEIEARQRQYEYYRDKLLTFKKLETV